MVGSGKKQKLSKTRLSVVMGQRTHCHLHRYNRLSQILEVHLQILVGRRLSACCSDSRQTSARCTPGSYSSHHMCY